MSLEAYTDRDAPETGAVIRIDRGYRDTPIPVGEEIRVSNTDSGHAVIVTVVSSVADRLELSDGKSTVSLKPDAAGMQGNMLDKNGKHYEAWIVL